MSDQHRADCMGCEGDPYVNTPALDSLASRGARFSAVYCPFPICGPSRMSFMTCRQPYENRHWDNEGQLNSSIPTFAHAFTASGYDTVLSGRMHFVGSDQRHGFSKRIIGDTGGTAFPRGVTTLKEVLGNLYDTPGMSLAGIQKSGPGQTGYRAYDEAVTRTTADWLQTRGRQQDPTPFLLTVGYVSPHCPFVASPEDFAYYADLIGQNDLPARGPELHPVNARRRKRYQTDPAPPIDAQWRTRVAYYGLCSFIDRQVGTVIDALDRAGLAENTIVVYTSDHGEMLGEHGMWWKSTFYDGATRVPLIISAPPNLLAGNEIAGDNLSGKKTGRNGSTHAEERIEQARRIDNGTDQTIDRVVSLVDVGTTLIDLAGIDPLPGATGRSLVSLLHAEDTNWNDIAFAEYTTAFGDIPSRMVRYGPWKYNYYYRHRPEFYNLKDDPAEMHDLWDEPDYVAIRKELHELVLSGWNPAYVEAWMERCKAERDLYQAWVAKSDPPEPDPPWFQEPPENWVDDRVKISAE